MRPELIGSRPSFSSISRPKCGPRFVHLVPWMCTGFVHRGDQRDGLMSDDRQSPEQILQDGLPAAPAIGERVLWDDDVRGLGLRHRPAMSPTCIYRRRVDGRLVKRTLARTEAMSLGQARAATAVFGDTKATGRVEVSLVQFAATFMCGCASRWKPATVDELRRVLRRLERERIAASCNGQQKNICIGDVSRIGPLSSGRASQ